MKISEMNNDQATDAMVRISAALGFICEDEEMLSVIDDLQNLGNTPIVNAIPRVLPKFASLAFRKHKDSLYEIIGALCQKSKKDVGKMNFKETITMIKESYDDVLRDFFTSSVPSRETSAEELV